VLALDFADLVNGNDIWVVKCSGGFGFGFEAFD